MVCRSIATRQLKAKRLYTLLGVTLTILGGLGFGSGARADELILSAPLPLIDTEPEVFVIYDNAESRQGIQFDVHYDPLVATLLNVTPLGRIQGDLKLFSSNPNDSTLRVLIYADSTRTAIPGDSSAIAKLTFNISIEPEDPKDHLMSRVVTSEGLAADEELNAVVVAPGDTVIVIPHPTPTLIQHFSASRQQNGSVRIDWELAPTLSHATSRIHRRSGSSTETVKLQGSEARGTGPHAFVDTPPARHRLEYDLAVEDESGEAVLGTTILEGEGDIPLRFALYQSAPNPFSGLTTISFDMPRRERVSLQVFDVAGRSVATIAEGTFEAGRHPFTWDGRRLGGRSAPPGIYLYRVAAGEFSATRKLVKLR